MSISFGLFVDFVFVYKSLFAEILNKVPGFLRIHKIIFFFLKKENKKKTFIHIKMFTMNLRIINYHERP